MPKSIDGPARYERNVRIPVRIVEGHVEYFYGGDLPAFVDGAVGDLVLSQEMLVNEEDLRLLQQEQRVPLLQPDTELLIRSSSNGIPERLRKACRQETLPDSGPTMTVPVVLKSDLIFRWRGPKRGRLEPVECAIAALNTPAKSVNHAYRLVSEAFEPARRSHAGNVFNEVFFRGPAGWRELNVLRQEHEARFEHRLSRVGTPRAARAAIRE
jgi:hypothetical protein